MGWGQIGWDQAALEGVRTLLGPNALEVGQSQDARVVSCGYQAVGKGAFEDRLGVWDEVATYNRSAINTSSLSASSR